MKWHLILAVAASFGMAGCGGNPFIPPAETPPPDTEPPPPPLSEIPAALRGNLESVRYDAASETLTAQIVPLDASPVTVTFHRDSTLDTQGYEAFTYQETSSNRVFLALFDTSADGAASAGVAGSGQFTEMVWGSNYRANTAYSAPQDGGLASYTGRYTGILNTGIAVPGPGAPFDPSRPLRTEGDVLLNADFTDSSIEGGIRNRRVVESEEALDDVFLQITEIGTDGGFQGRAVLRDTTAIGTYGGVIAGAEGTAIAGGVEIRPDQTNSDLLERGVFVLDRCGAGSPPPCPITP